MQFDNDVFSLPAFFFLPFHNLHVALGVDLERDQQGKKVRFKSKVRVKGRAGDYPASVFVVSCFNSVFYATVDYDRINLTLLYERWWCGFWNTC